MANFTPQEIEEMLQEFFDTVGKRQYTGARYVPIFGRRGSDTCDWDNSDAYEPLTIVIYQGNSYTSKQYVPKDVDITDTNYWVQTGNWNAQIEQYRQEVLRFQDKIDEKIPWPIEPESKYGTEGQVLGTLLNGLTKWIDPVVVTSEIAGPLIEAWLDAHPEATTTVTDGSISDVKMSATSSVMMYRGNIPNGTTAISSIRNGGVYNIPNSILANLTDKPENVPTVSLMLANFPYSALQPDSQYPIQMLYTLYGTPMIWWRSISASTVSAWQQLYPVADGAIGTDELSDGSVTDAKLVQDGGVLDRVASLDSLIDDMFDYETQILDNTLYEQKYYWYNSGGNITKNYSATGTSYYAYPMTVLKAGTYAVSYVPSNFSFLKDIATGTVTTFTSNVSNNVLTVSADSELYFTVYDGTGTVVNTAMISTGPIPSSYVVGPYLIKPAFTTINSLNCANETRKIVTVGEGADYATIQAACDAANIDDIVFVFPGTYTEQISIWGKRLHIIGLDKHLCRIVDHSGEYDTPPVEMNIGTLANLTIIEDNSTPSEDSDGLAYCIHNDNYLNTSGETFEIVNCDMRNDVHACIGFGMYENYTVIIRDCTMRSSAVKESTYKRGALYYHANSGQNVTGQRFIVENCTISCADTIVVYAGVPSTGTGEMLSRFTNNTLWSDINANKNTAVSVSENAAYLLDSASSGNNIARLNNSIATQGTRNTVTVTASSSAVINNKKNRLAQGNAYTFMVTSEDNTSYSTGFISWNATGPLVIEQIHVLSNITISAVNGELRVWNRDTSNNHTYDVCILPIGA